MQEGKCQCKFGEGWYNVIWKVKTLPANKMYTSFEIWLVFSIIFVKFNDNPNNNQLYRWWQFSLSQDLVVFILRSF